MFCGLSVYQERVIGVGGSTYMELGDELSADFSLSFLNCIAVQHSLSKFSLSFHLV